MTDTPNNQIPPPPPPPPPPAGAPLPPSPVDPRSAVQGPAIGLMVLGIIFLLYAVFVLFWMLLGLGMSAAAGQLSAMNGAISGIRGIFSIFFNLTFGGLIVYGATQMRALRNYNMAMTASVVAMLPCGCCCIVGLPIGIWSLVVLLKPEVKAAFESDSVRGFPVQ
jgi:hypothetical protein